MTYSEKLKDPRWQKRRLKILERDEWKCVYCKDQKSTLHVHHLRYSGAPWNSPDEDLETVCEHCHAIITANSNGDILLVKSIKYHYPNGLISILGIHLNSDNVGIFVGIYEHHEGETKFKALLLKNELDDLFDILKGINGQNKDS